MADFNTHVSAGFAVCGLTATYLHAAELIQTQELVWLTALGAIGGLLPDIDSDNSIPVRVSFTLMAIVLSLLTINLLLPHTPILLACLFGVATYGFVRYGVFLVFTRLTRHRGMIHSVPCGVWFGLLCVLVFHTLGYSSVFSWLCGCFLTFGFCIHLALDECYSVNLFGVTIKRSFGSAFKLFSFRYVYSTIVVYVLLLGTVFLVPPIDPLLAFFSHPDTQRQLADIFYVTPSGRQ